MSEMVERAARAMPSMAGRHCISAAEAGAYMHDVYASADNAEANIRRMVASNYFQIF